ncbi:hypothetical protein OMO38_05225 [Chryseobacterium sp. 09-1422]|uniref:Uncharacterized protein n=1 Tax=Chryseobacterium kimseyorum TaxID=2984028 RepID=A0ABT3HVX9_9FLAO|nr:hypothetical protein [Chryseobacterium kimseyorum]MCW3167924.1 hypothetical protein [Chryseobacterium kimseyorum]
MITPEQANDIRAFLIKELNNNGFSDVVTQVNTRLEEEYEEEKFEGQSRHLLDFYLTESIEILENLSNKNFQGLINRLNEFTNGKEKIKTINVELLNSGEQVYYSLSELPNYEKIISTFREILQEIRKEN